MTFEDLRHEALRRSEARLQALLDAIPDLMIRFDRDGTYIDIAGDTKAAPRAASKLNATFSSQPA